MQWRKQTVQQMIKSELDNMGIPRLFVYGVIKSITVTGQSGGLSVADVYLNGASTASTNIPVNPDIALTLKAGDPVWVIRVNFDSRDMFVLSRHNGQPEVGGQITSNVTDSSGNAVLGTDGVLSEFFFQSSGANQGWQNCGWFEYSSAVNSMALLFAYIPANFTITSATLYAKHLPYYENDSIQKWWFLTNGQLMYGQDAANAYYNGTVDGYVQVNNMTDITAATWGSYWNPTSHTVAIQSCDVKAYLTPGQRVAFGVNSHDSAASSGQMSGYGQLELVVTGYKSS